MIDDDDDDARRHRQKNDGVMTIQSSSLMTPPLASEHTSEICARTTKSTGWTIKGADGDKGDPTNKNIFVHFSLKKSQKILCP